MNFADKTYQDLLNKIINNGREKKDRTGTGTLSIPFATIEFDLSKGFPLLTTKKLYTKAIVHELIWFLNGDTNIKYLEDNGVSIWSSDAYREYLKKLNGRPEDTLTKENFINAIRLNSEFANKFGELGPIYGSQWRHWNYLQWTESDKRGSDGKPLLMWEIKGIDQISIAMDKLINNPDDRRILVSAWNVDELSYMALPPCHWAFELYTEELTLEERMNIHNGRLIWAGNGTQEEALNHNGIPKRRLHLKWHQRSVDTFLGLPFNIASYGILLHMFAQQANMVVGTLVGDLSNVHIYNNHIEQCKEQISRESRDLPNLVLNKAKDIFSYKYDDIKFDNYNPHDVIKGEISV
jgi:thymidylate synthase